MKNNILTATISALIGALTVISIQACGQGETSTDSSHSQRQPGSDAASQSPSDRLHAIMMRPMVDIKMTGDVDKDFAALMIPHHQGAIDMATIEVQHGKNAELKKLAQNIINSQNKEIEILKAHAK
ncbi:MAG: hypothetical protein HONBIEJF_00545 [Fimbriimonadaceae bacterium]|nr:hypothetical protein [Fimbriimonadaceae bacterium]